MSRHDTHGPRFPGRERKCIGGIRGIEIINYYFVMIKHRMAQPIAVAGITFDAGAAFIRDVGLYRHHDAVGSDLFYAVRDLRGWFIAITVRNLIDVRVADCNSRLLNGCEWVTCER